MKRFIVWLVGIMVLLSSTAFALEPPGEVLVLEGTAVEVGTMWGEVNRVVWKPILSAVTNSTLPKSTA